MDAEQWRHAEAIYLAAMDPKVADREAFILTACDGDEEMLRAVRSLMVTSAEDSPESIDDPLIGQRIGAFRLTKLLGKGGMGAVYLAERADGSFEQLAAVKLVKRGMDTDFVVSRFRQERQILAGLNHQYVARLFDGGSTRDGLPYFVMEYVEGLPIYQYCEQKNLDLNQRLSLFCKVCEAVVYAHAQRVVHRDLKPSNILVTQDGSPRLLDFGIAKLLNPDFGPEIVETTGANVRLMTPEYASPEQAKGMAVGVETDVYALGIMLFELTTGRRPYKFPSHASYEIVRVICEVDPPRPSEAVRIADLPASPTGALPEWNQQLKGNLDNLILQALAKDSAVRYRSVQALLDDIRAYMAGLPINANAPNPRQRISRRVWFAAAAVLVAIVLLGVLFQRQTKPDAGGQSVAILPLMNLNGDEATQRFAKALQEELVTELAGSGWRIVTRDGDSVMEGSVRKEGSTNRVTVRMVKRADQSVIWAKAFEGASEREIAGKISSVAAGMRPSSEGSAETTGLLVEGYSFLRRDVRKETKDEARARVAQAIAIFEKVVAIAPKFARGWAGLSGAQWQMADQYDHPEFEQWMRKAEQTARRALELDSSLDEAHATLGAALYFGRHDFPGALNSFARSVEFNPRKATQQRLLSDLLCLYGRFNEALAELQRAQALEPLDVDLIAQQAIVYFWKRSPDEAAKVARRAIASNPDHWYGHWVLGLALQQQSKIVDAEKEFETSQKLSGSNMRALTALGHLYGATGRREKALEIVAEIKSRSQGILRRYIYPQAMILASIDEKEKAFALLEKSYEIGDLNLPYTKLDPRMDSLRNDARYRSLMKRLGLPE